MCAPNATGSTPSAAATPVPGSASSVATGKSSSTRPSGRERARSTPLRVWKVASRATVEPARVPQRVRARERRVPAQGDLGLGREPAQAVRAVVSGEEERRLRVLHLGRDARHPRVRPLLVEEAHAGRVAPERLGSERVDDEEIHPGMLPGAHAGGARFSATR